MNRGALFLVILAAFSFLGGCVQQQDQFSGKGFLEGKVIIGPLCPVVISPPDPECRPTKETYGAWPIAVYTSDRQRKVARIEPRLDGMYRVELSEGTYLVDLEKQQQMIGKTNLPAPVRITAGKTTTLALDIDTGIR